MSQNFTATVTISINAPITQVWDALINPKLVKLYLFGTDIVTSWKVGAPIIWKGEWQGKKYQDKGKIIIFEPLKLLETTYWSIMSGLADKAKNYKKVSWKLTAKDNQTQLALTQDNNSSEEDKKHSEQNWKMVLGKLKELLEK